MRKPTLPVDACLPELLGALASHPSAVLVAPPGAGKTTRVPPALLQAPWLEGRCILMLQPRRVAARASAARIAVENGWVLGREVGYQIRHENRTTAATRIRVVTEGILTRRLQGDPFIEDVGCVILDEFHERSIHTDLAIAFLREIQGSVRPDLRLLVMSATMEAEPVSAFLGDAPVVRCDGRLHPIEIVHQERPDSSPATQRAADLINRLLELPPEETGHLLAFLPGLGEIRQVEQRLRPTPDDRIHILHSSITSEDQDRALAPFPGRKVVLATNIAETSITIDGVRTVIDSGLVKVPLYDARLGIDRLETRRVSLASATQRAGRAGRTAPGRCFRLWTRAEEGTFDAAETPEILRSDLIGTVLAVLSYGARDLAAFGWFQPPTPESLAAAMRRLEMLEAVVDGRLTELGKALATMPLHPRLGVLLVEGARRGHGDDAALMAAVLAEGDFPTDRSVRRGDGPKSSGDSDVLDRVDALHDRRGASDARTASVLRLRDDLRRLLRDVAAMPRRGVPEDRDAALMKSLLAAYPDRLCLRRTNDAARAVMVGGRGVALEPESAVRKSRFFLAIDVRDVPGTEARVAVASAVDAEWLEEVHPKLLTRQVVHRFDAERERVLTVRETRFCDLLVREDGLSASADRAGAEACLVAALEPKALELFLADEAAAAVIARLRLLRRVAAEHNWPTEAEHLASALEALCDGRTDMAAVRSAGLASALVDGLEWKTRKLMDELAPTTFVVPSGFKQKIQYALDDSPPIMAVRVQELFGLAETPRVAGGRVAVVLHLLSPAFRPVQITTDLKNFWNSTYAEVRKDLRARYPKHPWPENPWEAQAVAVGRRRH